MTYNYFVTLHIKRDFLVRFGQKIFGFLVKAVVSDIDLCDVQQNCENKHGTMRNSHQTIEVRTLDGTRTHYKHMPRQDDVQRGQQHAGKTGLQPPKKIECMALSST